MSSEMFWLTATVAVTALFWLPYVLDRVAVRGLMGAIANPSPKDLPQSAWAVRAQAAHRNAVENLAIAAPLILMVDAMQMNSQATAAAAAIYCFARIAHFVIYTLGVPGLRTLAFSAGWAAQVVFILRLFQMI